MYTKILKLFFAATLLLGSTVVLGQDIINEELLDDIEANAKPMWGANEPPFTTNNTPDKYKNESAIIIGYKRSVSIDKKSRAGFFTRGEKSLIFYENVRFKIKLNDRNAVENFTEIYFRFNRKEDGFSARIFKPGVAEPITVSLADAVGVESTSDMPEFFKSFFDQQSGNQNHYFKVAIPGLEPGDILEYVSITQSKLNVASSGYIEFSPQYEVCNKSYPIMYNQIIMETDDKSFFKSMSFNGAPDFKKEASDNPEFFRYVFTDNDRGVEKDVNFITPFKVYPLAKFQVIYANNDKIKGALIGSKGELKTGFPKEELAKKAWEDFAQTGAYYFGNYGTVQNYLNYTFAVAKKADALEWTEKDYINKMYYKLRNTVLYRDNYYSDKTFAYMFAWLLTQRKINYDLIISISNNIGTLKDVLFDSEIRYVIRLNEKQYYFNCTEHSNPGDLVETLLNNEAYIIKEPLKKSGEQEITPIILPNTTEAENCEAVTINASMPASLDAVAVSRTSTFKGLSKTKNIDGALKLTTYILDDWKNTGGAHPAENLNDADAESYNNFAKIIKDRAKDDKPQMQKRSLENEYSSKITFKNFRIDSDGRSLKKPDLVYTEDFDINGFIRKAGKKYLVNIPGLIGSQLQIKKQERNRKYDISVGYPRTLNWTINFKAPDGYTVDGVKELNTSVDNEAGSFITTASEANGVVSINVKKVYKQANMPKDKWSKMLEFVDAAYNFTFKNILLTPKK